MKKTKINCTFTGILAAFAAVSMSVAAGGFLNQSIVTDAASVSKSCRTDQQIIEDIITTYGCNGENAAENVAALLNELNDTDSRQGKLWTDIVDYWRYSNEELTVNVDTLPTDLPDDNTMALTVLGYKLNDDGTMQDELIERLKVTLACAEQYPNAYVICTGGGTAKNHPDVTEGGMMGEWLLAHGLDEDRLIIEDKSRNTAENACFSYEILRKDYPQVDSIVLISSNYHITRASLLFEAAFMKSASENQTPEIHVISNCSCLVENVFYQQSDVLRMTAGGLLQMVGNNELGMQYLIGKKFTNQPKP
jgi:hypothetical protein